MNYNPIEIGMRIQNLRRTRKLTQERLSEELHISSVYLSMLETGTRKASLDVLISIAVYFDSSLDYLVFGKLPAKGISETLSSVIATLTDLQSSL